MTTGLFLSVALAYDTLCQVHTEELRLRDGASICLRLGHEYSEAGLASYLESKSRNLALLQAISKTEKKTIRHTRTFEDEGHLSEWHELFQHPVTHQGEERILPEFISIEAEQALRYNLLRGWAISRGYPELATTFDLIRRGTLRDRTHLVRATRMLLHVRAGSIELAA